MVKVVFPIFKALTFIKHVPFDQSIFDTLGKVAIDVSEKVYPILCIPSPVNLHEKLVSLPSLRFNEFTPTVYFSTDPVHRLHKHILADFLFHLL